MHELGPFGAVPDGSVLLEDVEPLPGGCDDESSLGSPSSPGAFRGFGRTTTRYYFHSSFSRRACPLRRWAWASCNSTAGKPAG